MELITCTKCKRAQERTEFYADSTKKRGYRSHCRTCTSLAHRAYCAVPENKARVAVQVQQYQDRHKAEVRVIWKASSAITRAVRQGLLVRPAVCSECGKQGKIEAAHDDYSKPFDIRWLCISCHRRWDRSEPKLIAIA